MNDGLGLSQDVVPGGPIDDSPFRQFGQWSLVWLRLRSHRMAIFGARILCLMIVLALVAPHIVPNPHFRYVDVRHTAGDNLSPRLWPPTWRRLMGTDGAGNAVADFVFNGIGGTLAIAVCGALLALAIGIAVGGESGFFGGTVDMVVMRIVDAFLTIPFLPFILLLNFYLPLGGVLGYSLLFGLITWPAIARLVRSYTLSLRQREFTAAARALGASDAAILFRHIIPNMLDVLVVSTSLNAALFIVAQATLAFLLGGGGPSSAEWGLALNGAYARGDVLLDGNWWVVFFPGMALTATVLAFNVLGDGLRDALDVTSTHGIPSYEIEVPHWRFMRLLGYTVSYVTPYASPPLGVLWRSTIVRTARRTVSTLEVGRTFAAARVGKDQQRDFSATSSDTTAARVLGVFVAALILVVSGLGFLWGHSPLNYAPHYAAPVMLTRNYGADRFAMRRTAEGWDVLVKNDKDDLVFEHLRTNGGIASAQILAHSVDSTNAPAMAWLGSTVLAAWVQSGESTLRAALITKHRTVWLSLLPGEGLVEHPSVISLHDGRFAVLCDWSSPTRPGVFDVYVSVVTPATTPHVAVHRLVRAHDYAELARGAQDGSGALDVVYLDRLQPGSWALRFQRFSANGTSLQRPVILGSFPYYRRDNGGKIDPGVVPTDWAIDVKHGNGGSVWAVWEDTKAAYIGHWARSGVLSFQTMAVPGLQGTDEGDYTAPRQVALAAHAGGGELFYVYRTGLGLRLGSQAFTASGRPTETERVDYDAGGAEYPQAGTTGGHAWVAWQRDLPGARDVLEASVRRKAVSADLATHLGINIGNVWGNITFLIAGSIAAGIVIGLLNVFVVTIGLLEWMVLCRLVSTRRIWSVYAAALVATFTWMFVVNPTPPRFVLLLGSMRSPYGPFIVAGGSMLMILADRLVGARFEPPLRAWLMVAVPLSYAGAMHGLLLIQSEIGRV